MGIKQIKTPRQTSEVNENTLKTIIEKRNYLFHRGKKIPTEILWEKLFPLATQIIEQVSYNPTYLD